MKRETLIIILFLLVIIICIFKNIRQKELFTQDLNRDIILGSLKQNVTDMNEILAHNVTNNTIDYIPHLDIIKTYEENLVKHLDTKKEKIESKHDINKEKIENINHTLGDLEKHIQDDLDKTNKNNNYNIIKSYNNGQELSILKNNFNDYMIKLNNGCLQVNPQNDYEVVPCNNDDKDQQFKITHIYNPNQLKANIDKNYSSLSYNEHKKLKYPFAFIKSKKNDNCIKNFHGKLSVEPCRESNGQMWQPLKRVKTCQKN
tara:strand:- start:81 stop:857 length:777 start_codon:yes stop_codon:yes gene_type:complete